MSLAERIYHARWTLNKIGREKLGARIGVASSTIQRWESESESSEPDVSVVEAIAHETMVSPCWLAFGQGPMKSDGLMVGAVREGGSNVASLALRQAVDHEGGNLSATMIQRISTLSIVMPNADMAEFLAFYRMILAYDSRETRRSSTDS